MFHRKALAALVLVGILLVGAVGPVAAHDWQVTVKQGPMELGIGSSPETPVAGMQTEFAARIADDDIEGDAARLSWGGVTNASVEVHVRGPDGYHDHVKTQIPEDDAHFHFTYVFPTDGSYSIAVVTELEGQEYAFQFQKNVTLLPAAAQGEEMEHLSEDVHAVNENVQSTNEKVDSLQSQVDELQSQVEALQSQQGAQASASNDVAEVEETAQAQGEETSQAQVPGFTITATLMALVAIIAFVVGRRRS